MSDQRQPVVGSITFGGSPAPRQALRLEDFVWPATDKCSQCGKPHERGERCGPVRITLAAPACEFLQVSDAHPNWCKTCGKHCGDPIHGPAADVIRLQNIAAAMPNLDHARYVREAADEIKRLRIALADATSGHPKG